MEKAANDNIIFSAKNITVRFGGLVAVNDVSIYLKKNEILGLMGPNGAGKTTFFNAISGVIPPSKGCIEFKGKTIKKPRPHSMCRLGIGRTYQICQPFLKQTLIENIMVGSYLRESNTRIVREKATRILEMLKLTHLKDVLGSDLTLIQLKRLEVARALSTEPDILLLDEVMAGLNHAECEEVMDIIQELRHGGMSIILVEHVMKATMGLSDRIYVLNQGNLIAEGTPQQVTNDPEVIKSYLGEKRYARH